ncbi:hypothetical protein [Paenibacillus soyae]|uniref:Lipoprotein n=1 Tax=Paenibacillus soyae TaxID=2969249 RepID=A0A9X2MNJ1_9BACL|nr:hypothetical protein [Paenibacillus soyae]MCR2803550.1 hypothetical protein [Paenibacillus soyae]
MKKIRFLAFITFVFLLSACSAGGESNAAFEGDPPLSSDYSFIPAGWGVAAKGDPIVAEGDLNKDGVQDVAMIIEQSESEAEGAPRRVLLIAFGSSAGEFSLSIIADKVFMRADEGGVWGDPFESLSIDRGSVVVSHYGGSNWRWYSKYRFRYQDDDWYLIGATKGEHFTGDESRTEEDYNLLTGDYIITTTNEEGVVSTEKGNRGKKPLVKLGSFDITTENW